jgi:hypothetical protein
MKRIISTSLLMGFAFCVFSTVYAQVLNQTDTFDDGSLNFWTTGLPNPTPPVNISSGGPLGSSDRYIRLSSSGGNGAGSRLIMNNTHQWTGNYLSAGISNIHMFLKNEGSSALLMRIALISGSNSCSSVTPVSIPAGGAWITADFPLSASALTGGPVSTILGNVTEIRLLHSAAPGTKGDPIAAKLGVDDITATGLNSNVETSAPGTIHTFELSQNYPNPFNPITTINYKLSAPGYVTLKVFNIIGKEVATLIRSELESTGTHSIRFDASSLSSGIYWYRMDTGTDAQTKRLVLLK